MQRLKRITSAPWFYLSWLVFVLLALFFGYGTDPYVFGFATLILAWLSGVVVAAGLLTLIAVRPWSGAVGTTIALSLGINVAVIVWALRTLHGFHWG